MSCQRFHPLAIALALLAAPACDASSAVPDAGACAGDAPCRDESCCGHAFRVCATSCEGGTWSWPVDDNCYFACHDAGVDGADADSPDADDGALDAGDAGDG